MYNEKYFFWDGFLSIPLPIIRIFTNSSSNSSTSRLSFGKLDSGSGGSNVDWCSYYYFLTIGLMNNRLINDYSELPITLNMHLDINLKY